MNQEAYRFGTLVAAINKLSPLNAHLVADAARRPAIWFRRNAVRVYWAVDAVEKDAMGEIRDPHIKCLFNKYRELVAEMRPFPKQLDTDGAASFWLGWAHAQLTQHGSSREEKATIA